MYFLYPETCGIRLEDMDALFGDALSHDYPETGDEASSRPEDAKRQEEGDESREKEWWFSWMRFFTSKGRSETGGGGRYTALVQGED